MMHLMIDLETMSLAPNAAIVSIGAVLMTGQAEEIDNFYRNVSLDSSVGCGLHMDPSTVMWWLTQSERARGELGVRAQSLKTTLKELSDWLAIDELVGVWGNGAAADNVWIAQAYRATNLTRPWSHKQDRCYRTFRAMHRDVGDPPDNGDEHNALADARWQAAFMRNVCKEKEVVLK